jgi:putative transposase
MARLPRLALADHVHHVIQRGNNRQPIFVHTADYEAMLGYVDAHARTFGVAVHAYVLMENHFHLLLTPRSAEALPRMMQAVGRSYVRYFNAAHGRSGTLWEGRYRSTVLEAQRYLLPCMVYLDLNPVRAGTVAHARDYAWSSHMHYVGARQDRILTPPPQMWELGNTPFAREAAYAQYVEEGLNAAQHTQLTDSALQGWVLGGERFVADLQKQTERRLTKKRAGRPAKVTS